MRTCASTARSQAIGKYSFADSLASRTQKRAFNVRISVLIEFQDFCGALATKRVLGQLESGAA